MASSDCCRLGGGEDGVHRRGAEDAEDAENYWVMQSDSVERYYDENPKKEWDRLEVRHDRVEYEVTLRALAEFLPHAPARILDVGGGPGRYSIALT